MKNTNIERTIKYVANEFCKLMKEEGFDSFAEMKRTYCWESKDIKEEIIAYTDELDLCYIDECDGTLVIGYDCSEMSYRSYANKIKILANKLLNNN